jgi:hypothetical protein
MGVERRGGLAVHSHLKLCWKLHREIARLRAAQNPIHTEGGTTKGVYRVGSAGVQTAVSGNVYAWPTPLFSREF